MLKGYYFHPLISSYWISNIYRHTGGKIHTSAKQQCWKANPSYNLQSSPHVYSNHPGSCVPDPGSCQGFMTICKQIKKLWVQKTVRKLSASGKESLKLNWKVKIEFGKKKWEDPESKPKFRIWSLTNSYLLSQHLSFTVSLKMDLDK